MKRQLMTARFGSTISTWTKFWHRLCQNFSHNLCEKLTTSCCQFLQRLLEFLSNDENQTPDEPRIR